MEIKQQPSEKEEVPGFMPLKAEQVLIKAEGDIKDEPSECPIKAETFEAADPVPPDDNRVKEEPRVDAKPTLESQAEPSVKPESQVELSLRPWTEGAPSSGNRYFVIYTNLLFILFYYYTIFIDNASHRVAASSC